MQQLRGLILAQYHVIQHIFYLFQYIISFGVLSNVEGLLPKSFCVTLNLIQGLGIC